MWSINCSLNTLTTNRQTNAILNILNDCCSSALFSPVSLESIVNFPQYQILLQKPFVMTCGAGGTHVCTIGFKKDLPSLFLSALSKIVVYKNLK